MAYSLDDKLVIGISSRALFDLDDAHAIFDQQGLAAYREYQREHEDEPLGPGTGFPLARALLHINDRIAERLVEVIVISRNDASTGLRVMNSIEHHGIDISRFAFVDGGASWRYHRAFHCDLFLTSNTNDAQQAADDGVPAALLLRVPDEPLDEPPSEVRIAFDGDAVLFSEESERIYREQGLDAFIEHEKLYANQPLDPGPLKPFLDALARIQSRFPNGDAPMRLALVTARNAPAHRRVMTTLRDWGINLNETFFLGGAQKAGVLSILKPHIFFDDQLTHLEPARSVIPSAKVPSPSQVLSQTPLFEV